MKFNKKSINKVVRTIDRLYEYDGAVIESHRFFGYDLEGRTHVIFEPLGADGYYWFSYWKNNKNFHKVVRTYQDLNELHRLVKVLF